MNGSSHVFVRTGEYKTSSQLSIIRVLVLTARYRSGVRNVGTL